jgi:acyl-CoA hydrolase
MSERVPAIKVLLLPKDTNALTARIGRTAITVKVLVEVERWGGGQGERVKVTEADVFVAIGADGHPTPISPS